MIDKSIDYTRIDFYRATVLGLSLEEEPVKEGKNNHNDYPAMKTLT